MSKSRALDDDTGRSGGASVDAMANGLFPLCALGLGQARKFNDRRYVWRAGLARVQIAEWEEEYFLVTNSLIPLSSQFSVLVGDIGVGTGL
jgi:hypothetical protein